MGTTPKWYEFCGDLQPLARSLCVIVPPDITASIGRVGQARVRISVNGYEAISLMLSGPSGSHFIKLGANFRKAAGIKSNEKVAVRLALEENDPQFEAPCDLRKALEANPNAMWRWERLPYRHKKGHVEYIDGARWPEARVRRIWRVVDALS